MRIKLLTINLLFVCTNIAINTEDFDINRTHMKPINMEELKKVMEATEQPCVDSAENDISILGKKLALVNHFAQEYLKKCESNLSWYGITNEYTECLTQEHRKASQREIFLRLPMTPEDEFLIKTMGLARECLLHRCDITKILCQKNSSSYSDENQTPKDIINTLKEAKEKDNCAL